jgi:hypothetical protein
MRAINDDYGILSVAALYERRKHGPFQAKRRLPLQRRRQYILKS